MNLEWMVVWEHRERFLEGAAMTIFLTVATMAIAIPGGLTLAFLRMSRFGLVRAPTMAFVEFFRATPLILQV
jgi:His/Glu/Gln/Arg/opine family amino acid ABC transporter permease subunit